MAFSPPASLIAITTLSNAVTYVQYRVQDGECKRRDKKRRRERNTHTGNKFEGGYITLRRKHTEVKKKIWILEIKICCIKFL